MACLAFGITASNADSIINKKATPPAVDHSVLLSIYGTDWLDVGDTQQSSHIPTANNSATKDRYELTRHYVPVVINDEVMTYIKYFQGPGKRFFSKWLERSAHYLPMIKSILAENGLPEDLVYLALIESGFSPHARSRANAVGIWQFMVWTGRHSGLRTDWWIDERKDPELATWAASRHLSRLYNRFGSWYLAAASYNAGEGRVSRAMKKSGSDDFWVITRKNKKTLKRETRDYVPKYLAAMLIAKDPEKYGLKKLDYDKPIAYDKVVVSRPTDIRIIAQAAETSVKEIKRLNPALLRWFTPPDYKDFEIKIPAGRTESFEKKLARIAPTDMIRFHRHKIRKGESLYVIGRKYGTPIRPIMYLNNLKKASLIRAGSTLVVPVRSKSKSTPRIIQAALPSEGTHQVKSGDTLWSITRRYGMTMNELLRINNIRKNGIIKPGQLLLLREAAASSPQKITSIK